MVFMEPLLRVRVTKLDSLSPATLPGDVVKCLGPTRKIKRQCVQQGGLPQCNSEGDLASYVFMLNSVVWMNCVQTASQ